MERKFKVGDIVDFHDEIHGDGGFVCKVLKVGIEGHKLDGTIGELLLVERCDKYQVWTLADPDVLVLVKAA